jgi:hypothetical protein
MNWMKTKPTLPPDKLPLQHHYSNWVFLKIHHESEVLEVRFDSKSGWLSAVAVSLGCLVFGTLMFWVTKHWVCYAIMIPTGLALLGMNWYKTNQEAAAGNLFRLHVRSGTVELPRHRETYALSDVTLKLQVYSLSDDIGCELNLQSNKTGKRFPVTKTLGRDTRILKLCETLAKHGLKFQEEDLTGFKRP